MSFRSQTDRFIDFVIPMSLLADREMRTRARMFLFSHLFGPFLGNVIPLYLFVIDPGSHGALGVLAAAITAFWLFPIALRLTGYYKLLSYISIQNLLFAILWGCFFYGGISSPFLPWLVTVPLLAFFYLGASQRTIVVVLSQVAINGIVFVIAYRSFGETEPRIPLAGLQGIGIISTMSAAIYVSMMAIYYARVLDSQNELEAEVAEHLATAAELRAATTAADRAGAAKANFLAKMSHELRTPLNAVIGYSQLLLEDADSDNEPQIIVDLDRIHSAGNRLLSIVNSILDLSKIEAGKMGVDISSFRVGTFVSDLAQKNGQAARLRGNRFEVSVDPDVDTIETDGLKLAHILDALVSNAIQYTDNGTVSLEAMRLPLWGSDVVRFTVADTGRGISSELLPILFDDFTRRNDQFVTNFGGAGLGLPLAHRLCRLIGATLKLESNVGIGTRAIVDVPRVAAPTPSRSDIDDRSAAPAPLAA